MPAPDPIPGLKTQVANALIEMLQGWTQEYAADIIGTDQPRISDLRKHRLRRFSLERLIRFVTRARGEVTLTIAWRWRPRRAMHTDPPYRVIYRDLDQNEPSSPAAVAGLDTWQRARSDGG